MSDMKASDVVIVGGGVIGLSIAYKLSTQGVAATVLDRGPIGRAASWAGAGILAPPAGHDTGQPDEALRTLSARLYPEWSRALREETGLDNGYRLCGAIDLALDDAEATALEARTALWRAEAVPHERLDPDSIRRVEPAVTSQIRIAYLIPGRAQIRNPRHLKALQIACQARGVRLRPGVAVEGFERAGDVVTAVRTSEGALPCGRVVVAAGAWSGGVLAGIGLDVPTPPVKGQMLLLRSDRRVLGRIVERGPTYLVPRDDGRVLVGATEEDAGFDMRSTATAVGDLIARALRLCPALGDAELERSWAGLRPGNRDNRPTIGFAPGFRNVIIATGHRRAGLQLSTGTAAVVGDLLLDRSPALDLGPFRPGRPPGEPAAGAFLS